MSTTPPPTTPPPTGIESAMAPPPTPGEKSVMLVSHSMIFYWWPVWFLAFAMAIYTYFENHRLAIVPPHGKVLQTEDKRFEMYFPDSNGAMLTTRLLDTAVSNTKSNQDLGKEDNPAFPARISQSAAPGAIFIVGLIITIVITNVPLRGLWSFLVLVLLLVVVLFITLLEAWDSLFRLFGNLHVHINMAGYLFIGIAVFTLWAIAVYIFDRRTYIVFTPGQIRYCEHIWDSVKVFPSAGAVMEKQRDDLFRHYIFGFFSGDLIVRVGQGNDRHELRMPNILLLGFRLHKVEDMLRRVEVA